MSETYETKRLLFEKCAATNTARAAIRVGCHPCFSHFIASDQQSAMAYLDTGSSWIAAGDPTQRGQAGEALIRAFIKAAARAKAQPLFFDLSPELVAQLGFDSIALGREPYWQAEALTPHFKRSARLKEQTKRAEKHRISIESVGVKDLGRDKARADKLDLLRTRWASRQGMPPMSFVVAPTSWTFDRTALYYVALDPKRKLLGYAIVLRSKDAAEVFIKDLIRDPGAPNGTTELLIQTAFNESSSKHTRRYTLGIVALAGSPSLSRRLVHFLARPFYSFTGLDNYRTKLDPTASRPTLLAFPRSYGPSVALFRLLLAFCDNRPLSFFWQLVRRGSTFVLGATAIALIPWMGLLALLSADWFLSNEVRWFWLCFDFVLLCGFFGLLKTQTENKAKWMAWLVSADALVSFVEFGLLPGPLAHLGDVCIRMAACLGPAVSAISLWGAVKRLRTLQNDIIWPSKDEKVST